MKRMMLCFLVCALLVTAVFADDGNVTYTGNAGEIVFAPGSDYSLTDLFPNFKGVMPGDSLTQVITVRNDASNEVKVKIYIRSKGAHEGSEEFLSQLKLTVAVSEENVMGYMFDAAAHETAQLTEWVCLGTLYSGGEVNLDVTLDVPVEMGNDFQEQIGYLDWEFMIEELPVDPQDPEPPKTGDSLLYAPAAAMICSGLGIFLICRKRGKKEQEGDADAEIL